MIARAVKDLLTEPMMNGVWGVTVRPDGSATPKPLRCAVCLPWTMANARPGMRCACISASTNLSIAAKSGVAVCAPLAAATGDLAVIMAGTKRNANIKVHRARANPDEWVDIFLLMIFLHFF